jgi:hypothetical protein
VSSSRRAERLVPRMARRGDRLEWRERQQSWRSLRRVGWGRMAGRGSPRPKMLAGARRDRTGFRFHAAWPPTVVRISNMLALSHESAKAIYAALIKTGRNDRKPFRDRIFFAETREGIEKSGTFRREGWQRSPRRTRSSEGGEKDRRARSDAPYRGDRGRAANPLDAGGNDASQDWRASRFGIATPNHKSEKGKFFLFPPFRLFRTFASFAPFA